MWNIKPGQLVEIHWIDPCAASHWENADEITACEQFIAKCVGWVHLVDDFGCVITACLSLSDDKNKPLLLRQHLPWGCIQEIWKLGDYV